MASSQAEQAGAMLNAETADCQASVDAQRS